MGIQIAGGFVAIQRPVHLQPRIRIECALNSVFQASTRNAHLRKRILMRITQSTSVGGLNLHWLVKCAKWSVLLGLSKKQERCLTYGEMTACNDSCREAGSWKLFLTVGLCPHTLQVSYNGRTVDCNIPPAHSLHQCSVYVFMHVIMRVLIGDSASSVQKLYANVTRPFPPRPI